MLGFPESITGGRLVTCDGGLRKFDSLAVEADGKICVATLLTGGITVASPEGGTHEFVPFDDPYTTNICFGGEGLKTAYITLSWKGSLVAGDWPRAGLALNFLNTYTPLPPARDNGGGIHTFQGAWSCMSECRLSFRTPDAPARISKSTRRKWR
jgi:gluconolactonase